MYLLSLHAGFESGSVLSLIIWKALCANAPFMPSPELLPVRSLDWAELRQVGATGANVELARDAAATSPLDKIPFYGVIQSDNRSHLM